MFSERLRSLSHHHTPYGLRTFYLLADVFLRHRPLVWTLIAFAGLLFILHAPNRNRFACFDASSANYILGSGMCKRVIAFSSGVLLVGFRRGIGAQVPNLWQLSSLPLVQFVDKSVASAARCGSPLLIIVLWL
jgi:hypothetical protein